MVVKSTFPRSAIIHLLKKQDVTVSIYFFNLTFDADVATKMQVTSLQLLALSSDYSWEICHISEAKSAPYCFELKMRVLSKSVFNRRSFSKAQRIQVWMTALGDNPSYVHFREYWSLKFMSMMRTPQRKQIIRWHCQFLMWNLRKKISIEDRFLQAYVNRS